MKINCNSIFEFIFMIFVAVVTNNEWQSNGFIWWGITFLLFFSYLFSEKLKLKIKLTHYKLWVFIFMIVCFFSFFIASDKVNALNQLKTMIIFNLVFIILEEKISSRNSIEKILYFFIFGITITLVYLLFNFDLNQFQLAQTGHGETGVWNGNDVALKAAVIVPLLLYFLKKEESKIKKSILIGIFLLCIKIILMTGSRKGLIMLMIGISGVITLKNPKKILRNGIIGIILIIIGFLAIMNISELYELVGWRIEGMVAMISGVGEMDSSSLLRKTYIDLGKKVFWDSPILGHGIANFALINFQNTGHYTYSHNNFIEILVGLGVIGFISYYWIYFYLIKEYIRQLIERKNIFLTNVLFINFILYFIMQYGFVSYFDFIQGLLILFLYFSLKIKRSRNE